MALKMETYFRDFLREIRLTDNQVSELKSAHETLRKRLNAYDDLKDIIVDTFLQGSYKRSTAVRPKNGNRSDVDIVIVTNLDKDEVEPDDALEKFRSFLEEYYDGKFRKQGRSWGIEMSHVDLDIVPTSAPSEVEEKSIENSFIRSDEDIESVIDESFHVYTMKKSISNFINMSNSSQWKDEPLYIPDRNAEEWDKTHPIEQIRWTIEKNKNCNGHYINVVKSLKWWRKEKYPDIEHPKSYPLEHFIGDCCPDGIDSVAQGITETLEYIVENYPIKPFLEDRGVPEHDVFARLTDDEYNDFYDTVKAAAKIARKAYDAESTTEAAKYWRELLGSKFPEGPKENNKNSLTKRETPSNNLVGGRFA